MLNESLQIELTDPLARFVHERCGRDGLYPTAQEYLRDLIRRDFEQQEQHRWAAFAKELQEGLSEPADRFVPFDPDAIINEARREQDHHAA